jgi:hypothetical protein
VPSTIPLQRSINYAQQFLRNAPLTFSGTNDPAFFNADWVRQFILSAPFAWRWNRGTIKFQLVQGQQDYSVAAPQFGWLQTASIVGNDAQSQSYTLEISNNLLIENNQQSPTKISAQSDDGNGNITFRLFPVPDKAYTLFVTFQNQSPTFQNTTDTWSPIPDYMSYLYNQGFLAKCYEYAGDPRFLQAATMFIRQLVACAEGIDESQKNLFLEDKLNTLRQTAAIQQGKQGRNIL